MDKHNKLQLKVADLIQSKKTDYIPLENVFLPELPTISEAGISGTLMLQSLNIHWIYAKLEGLNCAIQEVCESCSANYLRTVVVDEYSAKFLDALDGEEDSDDDVFLINIRNATIDIGEMIYHAIWLETPFVKRCPKCQESLDSQYQDEMEEREHI